LINEGVALHMGIEKFGPKGFMKNYKKEIIISKEME
jgi:hypothetical protein